MVAIAKLCTQLGARARRGDSSLATLEREHGLKFGPELAAWRRFLERNRLTEHDACAPEPASFSFLVTDANSSHWIAAFEAVFCGASLIVRGDDFAYSVAWAVDRAGHQRVQCHDWEDGSVDVHTESLPDFLASLGGDDEVVGVIGPRLPAHLDPPVLHRRSRWLTQVFLRKHYGTSWAALRDASGPADFRRERRHIAAWPHLAAYWLWSHLLFDNNDLLVATIELARSHAHPFVVESLALIERYRGGDLMALTRFVEIDSLRDHLARTAPKRVFTPQARTIQRARRRDTKLPMIEVAADARGQKRLLDAYLAADAVHTFDHVMLLASVRAREPGLDPAEVAKIWCDVHERDRKEIERYDKLAAEVTPALQPALIAILAAQAKLGDGHRTIRGGLIDLLAKTCADAAAFDRALAQVGTRNYGTTRSSEVDYALRRFAGDPRVRRRLRAAALEYVSSYYDQKRSAPGAYRALYQLDHPETATILKKAIDCHHYTYDDPHIKLVHSACMRVRHLASCREVLPALQTLFDHDYRRHGIEHAVLALAAAGGARARKLLERALVAERDFRLIGAHRTEPRPFQYGYLTTAMLSLRPTAKPAIEESRRALTRLMTDVDREGAMVANAFVHVVAKHRIKPLYGFVEKQIADNRQRFWGENHVQLLWQLARLRARSLRD